MLKTLLVDDNRLYRDVLRELLTGRYPSMVVEEAPNGKEAMQKVESFLPDLVLMDIRLPDGSGLELTKRIKEADSNIKVIILTAHHYPEYREAAARYGADGFLVKGESTKEILMMIESLFPGGER